MAALTVPYTELQQGVDKLLALPAPHYVLFTADDDPATGVSWCPDCVRCVPAVKAAIAERSASLLVVLVGPRPVWKDAAHPLRHDAQVGLTGVPTVMRWGASFAAGPSARLGPDLEAAPSQDAAAAVVAAFISSTA